MLVDWNFYSSKKNYTFPKMYKSEAHNSMLSVGAHYFKQWMDPVPQLFILE